MHWVVQRRHWFTQYVRGVVQRRRWPTQCRPIAELCSLLGGWIPWQRRGGSVGTVPPEISPPMPDKAQILIAYLRPLRVKPAIRRDQFADISHNLLIL